MPEPDSVQIEAIAGTMLERVDRAGDAVGEASAGPRSRIVGGAASAGSLPLLAASKGGRPRRTADRRSHGLDRTGFTRRLALRGLERTHSVSR